MSEQETEKTKSGILIGLIQLVCIITFIVASFAISAALGTKKPNGTNEAAQSRTLVVKPANVAPASHALNFTTTGTLSTRTDIQVTPQISGKVVAMNDNFFAGGSFAEGEVLFEIEPLDFKLEVDRLRAQVAQAQTALNLEKAESDAALSEWKMFNPDKAAPSLVARKPQLAEARANLRSAKAQLENAELDLERTKISMPFAGRVIEGNIEIGQFVSAGQSYGRVFNPAELEVEISLDATQLEWLTAGDNGNISITIDDMGQEKTYKGMLKRSASTLDQQTRFATIAVGFKDLPETLIPGVFAEIEITGPTQSGLTEIPANAIQNGGIVWEITQDNTLNALTPEIILTRENSVLVNGITGPKTIVTGKLSGATKGTEVRLENEAPPLDEKEE